MKVSIITVCFNSSETIEDTIKSVVNQNYRHIEHIVVDGGSRDGTLAIITKYQSRISKCISEFDQGTYHAMNKGIKVATGDIVGFLNAGDFYAAETAISQIVTSFHESDFEAVYGDLEYVGKDNLGKVVRQWKSQSYRTGLFERGWHPPHPTFFVKRAVFQKYGCFDLSYNIAADYELMLRFLRRHNIKSCYIPSVLVKMRTGGKSGRNLWEIFKANLECYQAWRKNGLEISPLIIFRKPFSKLSQLT